MHLVWPARNATADSVHTDRYLPEEEKARIQRLRKGLQAFFEFEANAAIAPMLASALDRVGRCRRALGIATPWTVLRCQDSDGGSRYELGLGIDVSLPTETELNQMAGRLRNTDRPSVRDAEIEGLLRSMTPLPADQDREGRWLLGPCGMRTVHRHSGDRLYLSNCPSWECSSTAPRVSTRMSRHRWRLVTMRLVTLKAMSSWSLDFEGQQRYGQQAEPMHGKSLAVRRRAITGKTRQRRFRDFSRQGYSQPDFE